MGAVAKSVEDMRSLEEQRVSLESTLTNAKEVLDKDTEAASARSSEYDIANGKLAECKKIVEDLDKEKANATAAIDAAKSKADAFSAVCKDHYNALRDSIWDADEVMKSHFATLQ